MEGCDDDKNIALINDIKIIKKMIQGSFKHKRKGRGI
jgi:hypothetical protein